MVNVPQLMYLNVQLLQKITFVEIKDVIGMELFVVLTHVPSILMIQQSVFMSSVMISQQSQSAHMWITNVKRL